MTKEEFATYQREWRKQNPEKNRAAWRRYYQNHREREQARSRKRSKNLTPEQRRIYNQRYYRKHKEEERAKKRAPEARQRAQDWRDKRLSKPSNRIRTLLDGIRRRAQKNGLVFDEALLSFIDQPPTHCVCCNIELDYANRRRSSHSRSPSFDRITGSGGYTVQNVAIICMRCNLAKSVATREELRLLLAYVEREYAARGL